MTSVVEGMLAPEVTETIIGTAEVREVFKISGIGKIAGCMVTEGFIRKAENVRLFREGSQVWDGKISALKRFPDDVSEVQSGFECGISLKNYENMKKGDVIECYSSVSKERKFVPGLEKPVEKEATKTDERLKTPPPWRKRVPVRSRRKNLPTVNRVKEISCPQTGESNASIRR